jgi:hypothetical protein
MKTTSASSKMKSIRCNWYVTLRAKIIRANENSRWSLHEYFLIQNVTSGANRNTCKEKSMIAKTCSQDGRREATRTDATIDAFREMLLVNFGLFSAPGGLIVEPE